jgi:methionine-S-sulfoxide reductase
VCGGDTGHNEVVRVSFDSSRITLREVLEIFFHVHDPTTLNRQGNDSGTQYRSGIYFNDAEQERVAQEVLAEANAAHRGRVVTEVKPLANYWRAEDYHQHYFANHPGQGYCLRRGAQGGKIQAQLCRTPEARLNPRVRRSDVVARVAAHGAKRSRSHWLPPDSASR